MDEDSPWPVPGPGRVAHCWGNMVRCRGSTLFLLNKVQDDGG